MINKTGKIISLFIGDSFLTLYPEGSKIKLRTRYLDSQKDGIVFREILILGVDNDVEGDIIIVDEDVAKYMWSIGKYNYYYLGHGFIKNDLGDKVCSYQLVCYKNVWGVL